MRGRATIRTRHYRSSDRRECRELWRQLTEKHVDIYSDPSIAKGRVEDYFDKHLDKIGSKRIWVATIESRVVGFVGLVLPEDSEDDGEIEPLIVHRDHRGKGVGSTLALRAAREAERLGVKYVTVRPVARNIEALRFFRDAGFDKVGRVELFKDLTGKKWEKGLQLHDLDFEF